MHWNREYSTHRSLWGNNPSELAIVAVEYLKKSGVNSAALNILDIGCGYGRDAFHYTEYLRCAVSGIDKSERAIELAVRTADETKNRNVAFKMKDFSDLGDEKYDIVTASNLYQLLRETERKNLVEAIAKTLKPGGLLFLSTLSIDDPEHARKGEPIPGDLNSFQDKVYLHLCTKDELMTEFAFLNILELYEHEYDEPRATGEVHHHISWILIGKNDGV
jgi:2-polyprenyl-3-methyl-5-hydroxy-6-metoxy-1,4-benzoquinol methylase